MTIAMLTSSILLEVLYVGIATWRMGELPESVSAMVYLLGGGWRKLWSLWLAVVTLLLSPALIGAMPDDWRQMFGYALVICLAMTAAIPLMPGYHNRAHYVLGITSGILSQACVWIICPWWLFSWILLLAAWICTKNGIGGNTFDGKGVLVAEKICAVMVFGACFTASLAS